MLTLPNVQLLAISTVFGRNNAPSDVVKTEDLISPVHVTAAQLTAPVPHAISPLHVDMEAPLIIPVQLIDPVDVIEPQLIDPRPALIEPLYVYI